MYNEHHMNIKIIMLSVVGIVGFLLLSYTAFNKPQQTTIDGVSKIRTSPDASQSGQLNDHTAGSGKQVLVEYSDLQCPACKSFHEYIEQEKKNDPAFAQVMDKQYTTVFRHFPLESIHPNARLAAQSAEAAGLQDAFFPFIDMAFARQQEWSQSEDAKTLFINMARELALNVDQFESDLVSEPVLAKVEADLSSALSMGLNSTPTFFINDNKITEFQTFEDFKVIIMQSASN